MLEKTSAVAVSNASHRPPAYFEWFYFHFVTADGTALNMVLHETDIFGLKKEPYLSLTVLLPDRDPYYLHRDLASIAIGRDGPFMQVGEGLISEDDQATRFDIQFPGQGFFRGEISKLAAPLVIKDGILYEEPVTGRASHWIVQVPHATFAAVLQLDGKTHRLRGRAYQDHQWGTILTQEFVSDWIWGQFSNDRVAIVFFQILTQNGRLIERAGMVNEDEQFMGTAVETNYLDSLFKTDRPELFDGGGSVSFLNRCFQLEFDVSPGNLMRGRINEKHDRNISSYLRWSAVAKLVSICGPQPLHGISEYIRIRPAMYGSVTK